MYLNNRKINKKNIFRFLHFLAFSAKNQPKLIKHEQNWQNPNRLIKSYEIWYVDASQQKKMLQKNYFSSLSIFGLFGQKTANIDQK